MQQAPRQEHAMPAQQLQCVETLLFLRRASVHVYVYVHGCVCVTYGYKGVAVCWTCMWTCMTGDGNKWCVCVETERAVASTIVITCACCIIEMCNSKAAGQQPVHTGTVLQLD
jgi:hypothetical protein